MYTLKFWLLLPDYPLKGCLNICLPFNRMWESVCVLHCSKKNKTKKSHHSLESSKYHLNFGYLWQMLNICWCMNWPFIFYVSKWLLLSYLYDNCACLMLEAWWALAHGVAKSWTWLKWLSMHAHICVIHILGLPWWLRW